MTKASGNRKGGGIGSRQHREVGNRFGQPPKNVGGCGPGAGRTLYGQSGTQGVQGSPNPGVPRPGANKPI